MASYEEHCRRRGIPYTPPPAQPEAPPERARDGDGQFAGDDPDTPDVNEAWVGGKAPNKKKAAPAKKAAPKKKAVKKAPKKKTK